MAGYVTKVAGPLVVAKGLENAKMYDVVKVGKKGLLGEIIEIKEDEASIQVYEDTSLLGPGEEVINTEEPLSVELAPGLIGGIFDGIERPLDIFQKKAGTFLIPGIDIPSLSKEKKWDFKPSVSKGDYVESGDILGSVNETSLIKHYILVPAGIRGKIIDIKNGELTIIDELAKIEDDKKNVNTVKMLQKSPVRKARAYVEKLPPIKPLVSGQRIVDTLFPIAKGGTASIPGPFGSGKTVVQHQFSKWADADIIVFIGCGERGNEMTDVLLEFPKLTDPKSGKPLMERTVLIANTSNMPIAAREASVYTGVSIAEYFRDMGYNVALMADSTSRWAEALREMSGRLEEMPGEEGYPAYLGTRIAAFYERSGRVKCLGKDKREGTLTIIGSVSPPGGDLSEPVVQNTLRVVKVFWGLDSNLAYKRHFPAINWLLSYSLYLDNLLDFYHSEINENWIENRNESMKLLQREAELEEIVRLVGYDSLSPKEQLIMLVTKSIREDFLHQSAYMEGDEYTSLIKQFSMLKIILLFYEYANKALDGGMTVSEISELPVMEKIARMKIVPESKLNEIENIENEIKHVLSGKTLTASKE